MLYSTEGWFSAIYLNLRTFSGQAALPDHNSDIYGMFTSAMIDPLPKSQREFLAVMGLADEFTIEMAEFVTDNPDAVLSVIDNCPASTLKEHPLSLLVLMRSIFNWNRFPKIMEMRSLLMASIEEHTEMSAKERGNLLGECDLIMSFLCYNDISAMSRLHRSASNQMSRPAISIHKSGGWTFGSPSVLMMFHREPGAIKKELAEMDECMPHYYKITDGHGQGAEKIMWAEAALMQGQFSDTLIALETAYSQIEGNGQENMALCCDFLAQGAYAKVIGRSENQLAACQTMHYELVRIHLLIQTVAAYEMLGKRIQGQKLLLQACRRLLPTIFCFLLQKIIFI